MVRAPGRSGGAVAQTGLLAAGWGVAVLLPLLSGLLLAIMQHRGLHLRWGFSLAAYRDLVATGRIGVVLDTAWMAALVSVLCLLFGFPLALWLARDARSGFAMQLVWLCLTVPFFLDPSARGLALRLMLSAGGPVNSVLLHLHLVHQPVRWLLFSDFAVMIGLLGPYFPNMVWPIYLSLTLIDPALFDASRDLGASPSQTLRLMILPLALPGILAGVIMTFIPALGDNVVPDLLGGGRTEYIADSVMALSTSMNYAGASALATVVFALLGLLLLPFFTLRRMLARPATA